MVTAATATPTFDLGRVFSRAFETLGRNFVTFFSLSFLAAIPNFTLSLAIFGTIAPTVAMQGKPPAAVVGMMGGFALIGFFSLAASFVLSAALAHGTYADLSGKRASFIDCIGTGLRHLFPLVAIALLASVAVVFALFLLIVPGIMLLLAWSVIVPVRVVERVPVFDTFGRSAALTRGHRWAILGIFVILIIGGGMAGLLVPPLAGLAGSAQAAVITALIIQAMLNILVSTVNGTISASIYYELRSIKEGIGPEQLAAVFD